MEKPNRKTNKKKEVKDKKKKTNNKTITPKKKIPKKISKPKEEYYVLELSVDPGGARKNDFYLLSTLQAVWNVLQEELTRNAGLAVWYGEDILLYRCVNNKSTEVIDLHPFITFYIGDFPPIKFGKNNKVKGYTKDNSDSDNSDSDPIDFTLKDIDEVYRYLNYDIHRIFRIMKERNLGGTNMERYPPNVGVQIDLSSIPRIEEPDKRLRYNNEQRDVDLDGIIYSLKPGLNNRG